MPCLPAGTLFGSTIFSGRFFVNLCNFSNMTILNEIVHRLTFLSAYKQVEKFITVLLMTQPTNK